MLNKKKKRNINKNKVIGSIQFIIGILLLVISIFGLIANLNHYAQNKEELVKEENSIKEDSKSLQSSTKMLNETKLVIFIFQVQHLRDNQEKIDYYYFYNWLLVIISLLLSILFITQGIVNFGLNKEKNGK